MMNTESLETCANLRELLELRAADTPAKTFLYDAHDGRVWTYAQFDAAVNRTAEMLSSAGAGRGDVVSLLLPNSAEYVIAYFACFKTGALAGPVNSLLKAEEAAYVVGNSDAKALLYHSQFRDTVNEIQKVVPGLTAAIEFDDEINANSNFTNANSAHARFAATPDESWRELSLTRDDEAIIIYTSGTTGKPKGCLLTHGNLLANARQIVRWMRFTPADRLLSVMPLFHMNAVMVTTIAAMYAGGSSVVSPRFSASRFWQIISDYEVTSFGSVATMLSMLLATYPEGVPANLQTAQLRFAMCGSAPVPAEVLRRFEETFGCLVIEGYGLSESTVRATFNPPDERRRPGSCGQSIGCEIKIFDGDEKEVPTGTLGEIVLRGENIFKGYYKNEAATAEAFRGGWFHTGDVGYADADGFIYIADRMSDMIIRGGENIYPREIDELLYRHPSVASAATIGVPDNLYGEEVAAFVVLKDGSAASAGELMEYCRAHLADFKCPKTIRFLTELPKGATGKVLKRELARKYKLAK
jgi:long-chain acyl-CoA synthetase